MSVARSVFRRLPPSYMSPPPSLIRKPVCPSEKSYGIGFAERMAVLPPVLAAFRSASSEATSVPPAMSSSATETVTV